MAIVLDWLLGRPNPRLFARRISRELRKVGWDGYKYDAQRWELRPTHGDTRVIYLGNVYVEHANTPRRQRRAVIDRFISAMTSPMTDVPASYAEARARMLPIVRSEFESVVAMFQIEETGSAPSADIEPAGRPVAGELTVGLAFDSPHAISRITNKHLHDWGVGFDEVLTDALDNLRLLPEQGWRRLEYGVWRGEWNDNYESSRLLIPDLIYRLGVADPVICVPTRNLLLVASGRDMRAVGAMGTIAKTNLEMFPRWLSGDAFKLVDGAWQVFEPPGIFGRPFREMKAIMTQSTYNEQKGFLERRFERDGVDRFVASVLLVNAPDGGAESVAIWADGVRTLLPRVDKLAFTGQPNGVTQTIVVPWDSARQIVDELLEQTSDSPPRFRTRGFPSGDLWMRLAEATVAV